MTPPIQEPSDQRTASGLGWGVSQLARRPAQGSPPDWARAEFTTDITVPTGIGSPTTMVWDTITLSDATSFDVGAGQIFLPGGQGIVAAAWWFAWTDPGYADQRVSAFAYQGSTPLASPNPVYVNEKLGVTFMYGSISPYFCQAQGTYIVTAAQSSGSNKTITSGGLALLYLGAWT